MSTTQERAAALLEEMISGNVQRKIITFDGLGNGYNPSEALRFANSLRKHPRFLVLNEVHNYGFGNGNIVEAFLGELLQYIDRTIEEDRFAVEWFEDALRLIAECGALLKIRHRSAEDYYERFDDELSQLIHRARLTSLDKLIEETVQEILRASFRTRSDGTMIVAPIDGNELTPSDMDDIYRWLAVKNVVLLISTNREMLSLRHMQKVSKDFSELRQTIDLPKFAREEGDYYLSKVFPPSTMIKEFDDYD
jgi:hypothetical protein